MTTCPDTPDSVEPKGTAVLESLQSKKLADIKASNGLAEIYLQNGIRIVGRVLDFDAHGVMMERPQNAKSSPILTRSMISSIAETDQDSEARREHSPSQRRAR